MHRSSIKLWLVTDRPTYSARADQNMHVLESVAGTSLFSLGWVWVDGDFCRHIQRSSVWSLEIWRNTSDYVATFLCSVMGHCSWVLLLLTHTLIRMPICKLWSNLWVGEAEIEPRTFRLTHFLLSHTISIKPKPQTELLLENFVFPVLDFTSFFFWAW